MHLQQLDVKTTFSNDDLEEIFSLNNTRDVYLKEKNTLYDLKESPGKWYKRLDTFM